MISSQVMAIFAVGDAVAADADAADAFDADAADADDADASAAFDDADLASFSVLVVDLELEVVSEVASEVDSEVEVVVLSEFLESIVDVVAVGVDRLEAGFVRLVREELDRALLSTQFPSRLQFSLLPPAPDPPPPPPAEEGENPLKPERGPKLERSAGPTDDGLPV